MGVNAEQDDLSREKAKLEQELRIQRLLGFAAGIFQEEITVRVLLQSLVQAVVVIDAQGIILLVNNRAEELFGYRMEELVGKRHNILLPERFHNVHDAHMAQYFKGPKIRPMGIGMDLVALRKDGSEFPVEISLSFVQTSDGILIMSLVTDITIRKEADEALKHRADELDSLNTELIKTEAERKQIEAVLHKNEEQFRVLVTATSDVLYHMSSDWSEMRQLSGRNFFVDLLKPTRTWLQDYIHPDDQLQMKEATEKAIQTKGIFELDYRVLREDGTFGWVFSRAVPLMDANGKIIEWFGAASDITERKRLEEDLKRRNDELTILNKELEFFSYSVAHDLRGPLSTINGFVSFLMEDCSMQLNEECKDYINRITVGTKRMASIIDDIFALSNISRQEMEIVDLNLSEMAQLVINELYGTQPDRSIEVRIEKGLRVQADARMINVALGNLLGNAWKYTEKTELPRIEFGSFIKEKQRIYYVKDNGAGFDMSQIDRLFIPFKRLHSEKEFKGTGIGLPIVERAINRHGGKVWAEGEPGKGATFYFTLSRITD
jgi:PAS domain S-box-containing protein